MFQILEKLSGIWTDKKWSKQQGNTRVNQDLVTIWQGLIVGDGDAVKRPGEELFKRSTMANYMYQLICTCFLAAQVVDTSRKVLSVISCLSSLGQAVLEVAAAA